MGRREAPVDLMPQWVKYVTWRDVALFLIGADLGSHALRAMRSTFDLLFERWLSGAS